jgi:hypothetical protein
MGGIGKRVKSEAVGYEKDRAEFAKNGGKPLTDCGGRAILVSVRRRLSLDSLAAS